MTADSHRRAASCAALLAALACAHAGGPKLPHVNTDAAGSLTRESIPAGSIPWTSSRRLSWSDFAGAPQLGSDKSAVTSYMLAYSGGCESGVFTYSVAVAFVPQQSWVKPAVIMLGPAGGRALRHEQTHFDLGEVHAREMRRALARWVDPCAMSEEDRHAAVARLVQQDADAQARYDQETAHGLDGYRQAEWDVAVARQLTALRRYAQ
jgi:hypothetical protein